MRVPFRTLPVVDDETGALHLWPSWPSLGAWLGREICMDYLRFSVATYGSKLTVTISRYRMDARMWIVGGPPAH